jgi:hypothetical protein
VIFFANIRANKNVTFKFQKKEPGQRGLIYTEEPQKNDGPVNST